jgi:alkylation response protein AidB-like acyl-CoA dehydrogenase
MSFFDFLLDADARKVAAEARELARTEVDPEYLKAMDRDEVKFPREIYQKYGDRGLLGVRFPREYGGRGLNGISAIAALNAGVRHEKMLDDEGMWLAQ